MTDITNIEIITNPAVLTVGQVANTGLQVARDGIKDDGALTQIESAISRVNTSIQVSPDPSNTAVTMTVDVSTIKDLISTFSSARTQASSAITQCISLLTDAITQQNDGIVSLNRGTIQAIAIAKPEVEEFTNNNNQLAASARAVLLPAAGTEWTSYANADTMNTIVNSINTDNNNQDGSDLLNNAIELVPTDIGLESSGITVREGDVSLDSQSVTRPIMHNGGQDIVDANYLASADAFASSDIAVTPIGNMTTLLQLSKDPGLVQNSPYQPPRLIVVKNVDGVVTDVSYDTILPLTDDESSLLSHELPLLMQDWSATLFTSLARDQSTAIKYNITNYQDIPDIVTRSSGLLVMDVSGRVVSGPQAKSLFSGLSKIWNVFKNVTGASNANIPALISTGASVIGSLIPGSTGTTVAKIGNFVAQGVSAFQGSSIPAPLLSQKMALNLVPNLVRIATADSNSKTVASTVTANAVQKFSKDYVSALTNIPSSRNSFLTTNVKRVKVIDKSRKNQS